MTNQGLCGCYLIELSILELGVWCVINGHTTERFIIDR